MAEESGHIEKADTRVDEAKAWEMAHAEKPHRNEASALKDKISESEGKNGVGAFFKRWRLRGQAKAETKRAESASKEVEDTIDLFREIKSSENAQKFYDFTIRNSEKIGDSQLTEALRRIKDLSPEDLYKKQKDGSYYRDYPGLARMASEVPFAMSEKSRDRDFCLVSFGEPRGKLGLSSHIHKAETESSEKGFTDADRTATIGNAYTLLGLDGHKGDIPDMSSGDPYLGNSAKERRYGLKEFGLKLEFSFFTASHAKDFKRVTHADLSASKLKEGELRKHHRVNPGVFNPI